MKYIGVLASGYNVVDVDTASERGIVVTNVPGYSTASVAQHVFALIAALTNHAEQLSGDVHKGRWGKSKDFCFWDDTLLELDGKTFGILGLGAIGSRVATIARAFGMRVIAWNRTPKKINGARNCIITPHVGWASYEARKRLIEQAAKNLKGYITGNPVNIVKR